jgi:hypothetical protein
MLCSLSLKITRAVRAVVLLLFLSPCFSRADQIASRALAEMSAHKTKVFNVAASEKNGGTKFEISYPESWQPADSSRPSVVTRIAETNAGLASFVITVNPMTKTRDASPDKVFNKDFFAKFKLPGATLVKGERFKEGTFDGALLEYFADQSRGAMKFRVFVSNYAFVQNNAMVQLQFYVFLQEKEDKKADQDRISAFQPLWKAMLATLKLQP